MQFSVLIPIYNGESEKNFKECLESIINQTLKPDEILIVKDGIFSEKLEKLICDFQSENNFIEINTYQLEKNEGVGIASSIGTTLCKYNYIARIDSDDIAIPDRFEKQIKYLEQHQDIDILGGFIDEYDENLNKKISTRKVPLEDILIKKQLKSRCPFNHSTVIYKKDKIISVGNYSNKRIMEDYDLWIRCSKNNLKMHNLKDVLVKNRTGDTMYKKRSGKNYVKTIIEIENELYNLGMISNLRRIYNIILRSVVAMIPLKFRKIIYKNILR